LPSRHLIIHSNILLTIYTNIVYLYFITISRLKLFELSYLMYIQRI